MDITEALSAASGASTISESEVPDFVIDSDMRTIAVPEDGVVLGVEGDKDTNTIRFLLPKVYRGCDLSGFTCRVSYINAGGEVAWWSVNDLREVMDGVLGFTWVVSDIAVRYQGTIRFAVNLREIDESTADVIRAFDSTVAEVQSLEGLPTPTSQPASDYKDFLTLVDQRVTGIVNATIGAGVDSLTPAQIHAIVRSGDGAKFFPVGTQITTPWTYNGVEYRFVWDVLHHYDGSDDAHPLREMADGTTKPAMCIGAHYALPVDSQYGPREAAYVAQSALAAGTYHFAIKITTAWASAPGIASTVGTRQYQFTTTKSHPKGAQLYWEVGESQQLASAKWFDTPMSDTISETVAITETTSPTGTDLGTMTEVGSTAGWNNPQRTIYGNNNWVNSSLRLYLNEVNTFSDSLVTPWHRKAAYDGKAGILGGFTPEFRAVLGHVLNRTQPHAFDGDAIQTSDDVLYPLSAREHAFSNYLSNTSDGYNSEGVPLDYWTQLAKRGGISSGVYSGWQTYPDLITYDLANHTQARYVWERSANRGVNGAYDAGGVHTSGGVSGSNADGGYRCAPSACIV